MLKHNPCQFCRLLLRRDDDRAKAGVSHCKKVFSRESEAGNKQDEIEDLNTIWFKKSFYRCVIGSLRQSGSVHVRNLSPYTNKCCHTLEVKLFSKNRKTTIRDSASSEPPQSRIIVLEGHPPAIVVPGGRRSSPVQKKNDRRLTCNGHFWS